MCLTIPGKVLSVEGPDPALRFGDVEFCGTRRTVNFAYTPEVEVGDYVVVHVGFAVRKVEQEEVTHAYQCLAEVGALEIREPRR